MQYKRTNTLSEWHGVSPHIRAVGHKFLSAMGHWFRMLTHHDNVRPCEPLIRALRAPSSALRVHGPANITSHHNATLHTNSTTQTTKYLLYILRSANHFSAQSNTYFSPFILTEKGNRKYSFYYQFRNASVSAFQRLPSSSKLINVQ